MKLHTDGTIEGTPEEVAAYKREMYPLQKMNFDAEVFNPQMMDLYAAATKEELNQEYKPFSEVMADAINRQEELTEEQVSSLSTHRLTHELAIRTGVHAKRIGPDARISIIISDGENSSEKTFDGPAVILVNQD